MGAWGPEPFGNDDACDWLGELRDHGADAVRAGLSLATGRDYLEAPEGSIVVAAAEVVTYMRGRPQDDETLEEVVEFLAKGDKADDELVAAARRGLDRVAGPDSELRELWRDSEHYDQWRASIADLKRRLV